MSEKVLFNILKDLTEDAFEDFKWHLKREVVSGIEPIQESDLSMAARRKVVDLMVQKYQVDKAVNVTKSVLEKISRNDLVAKLGSKTSGAAGAGPGGALSPPAEDKVPTDDERLFSVRNEFISRVSVAVLNQLLDKLFEHKVITEQEMESVKEIASKADKARHLFDTVRRKGPVASSELIAALCEVDPCVSKQLNLI